jgi:hypothetical protein
MVAIEAHSGLIPHFTRAYFGLGQPPFLPPIVPTVGDEQGMLSRLEVAVGEEPSSRRPICQSFPRLVISKAW